MDAIDHEPLLTDTDLANRIGGLIGRAIQRQLWLLFLDEHSVLLPTLMPNNELPAALDGEDAALIASMLRQAIAGTPIESVVFVWERPGGPIASDDDRVSAAALGWACADAGVPVRAQLISHDFGVRAFGPEEYSGDELREDIDGVGDAGHCDHSDGVFAGDQTGPEPQAG
ncbi:MAG: hypothetical protein FWD85_10640 [Microbacteriaceae bacterium]|nr:hypothetical protein [Microbacteriaceae bacterium]MCL2795753.1 hypothetical protein [Microbacteriaceae bacterium]